MLHMSHVCAIVSLTSMYFQIPEILIQTCVCVFLGFISRRVLCVGRRVSRPFSVLGTDSYRRHDICLCAHFCFGVSYAWSQGFSTMQWLRYGFLPRAGFLAPDVCLVLVAGFLDIQWLRYGFLPMTSHVLVRRISRTRP